MTHLIIQLGVGFGGGAALPGLPGRGRIPARGIIRWQKMCHLIIRHPFPRTCPVSTSSGPADGPLGRMRAGRRVRHERPSTGRLRRSWRAARPAGRGYQLRKNYAVDSPDAPLTPTADWIIRCVIMTQLITRTVQNPSQAQTAAGQPEDEHRQHQTTPGRDSSRTGRQTRTGRSETAPGRDSSRTGRGRTTPRKNSTWKNHGHLALMPPQRGVRPVRSRHIALSRLVRSRYRRRFAPGGSRPEFRQRTAGDRAAGLSTSAFWRG